ncbi:endoribonuclease ysh1 [Trichoglossum hirsutum]|uniref:Endoribonuclease ysh1 n=1 Tax=Trichoglossum hirsutum TaxID=265104 RepID=A0A9P8LC69_9PEZI|nr:endoribonuclease ysh1 [Trichoglossum hirsutum]
MAKTNFQGRVFMTHPTKAIYKWLIQDSVRVGNTSSSSQQAPLYTEADHLSTFSQIEAIDYHTTHTISSIRITPYPAGHVLGAAMFLIEIAGLKILFTGDYSREDDRHLISAEVPKGVKIDVLITESTYGIASHVPRLEREAALMKSITGILHRGGRVLMPVFALGRAQELLLILDEYWARHSEFQKVPIYYASNLARKCMVVYQTYVGAMNDNIKRLFRERMAEAELAGNVGKGGPWDFKFIRSLKNLDRFDDVGGCVMLASPGMLQNGVSRELLERWAPDPRNGVIITGYSVEGTLAKQIMNEPDSIPAIMTRGSGAGGRGRGPVAGGEAEKAMIPRRCTVQEFSFAAHVDGQENREFIEEVAAPVVILVHGEQHNMMRLKSKLLSLNVDKREKTKVFSPKNCEELKIPFKADKTAKVVGKLAQLPPPSSTSITEDNTQLITGVLVQNDFKMSLMAPEDLREYAGLTTTTITCKQRLSLSAAGIELVKWALEGMFGSVEVMFEELRQNGEPKTNGTGADDTEISDDQEIAHDEVDRPSTILLVMGCVLVRCHKNGDVELEWEGNMLNDGIADAVMAVLFTVESSPVAVKRSSSKHSHVHDSGLSKRNPHTSVSIAERLERVLMFLESQFGHSITPIERPKIGKQEPKTAAADVDTVMASPSTGEDEDIADLEAQELARLHRLGVPVPGVEIRVDKHVAKVWLETLEVESSYSLLRDRVRVVIERAVETVAPLWTGRKGIMG